MKEKNNHVYTNSTDAGPQLEWVRYRNAQPIVLFFKLMNCLINIVLEIHINSWSKCSIYKGAACSRQAITGVCNSVFQVIEHLK